MEIGNGIINRKNGILDVCMYLWKERYIKDW